jgi:hypothetical protein
MERGPVPSFSSPTREAAMNRTATVLLALMITLGGCASGGGGDTVQADGTTRVRRNPNVISQQELADASINTLTLYDAITRLRPNWLRQRGATSITGLSNMMPGVMINESFSQIDALHSLRSTDASSVEYMSGADATTLYGTGYVNGLIKVKTGIK